MSSQDQAKVPVGGSTNEFLLVGNGGHYNRGCQAIELGTYELLRRTFGSFTCRVVGSGHTCEYDDRQEFESWVPLERGPHQKASHPLGLAQRVLVRLHPRSAWKAGAQFYRSASSRSTAVLAVGGDNFTLDYGRPDLFMSFNEHVLNSGLSPLVLWGCSVGPFSQLPTYERHVSEQLRRIPLILTREDETVDYLASIGVRGNVRRVADPAFLMPARVPLPGTLPSVISPGTVGLNLSTLVGRYTEDGDGDWVSRAAEAVATVRRRTQRPVALIPHVIDPPANDDHVFMSTLASALNDEQVTVMPRALTAPELKWVIGECEVFVGARTHATIAALSQRVPCGFIAYSPKARGICRMVMGGTDSVIEARDFSAEGLAEVVEYLLAEGASLRKGLQVRLPQIEEEAWSAGLALRELVEALAE